MAARVARSVMASLVLIGLVGVRPAVCNAWSPWPFSSDKAAQSKTEVTNCSATQTKQPEPSMFSKIGTGTKNFFTKIGNAVTGKKAPPERKLAEGVAYPRNPMTPQKETGLSAWVPSWMKPAEPKKPISVPDYLKKNPRPTLEQRPQGERGW